MQITIFMIGDSTMANKPVKDAHPERGWGQILPVYFKEVIRIDNHAMNGRSSKSFIDEGRWAVVRERLKPGDYVIIQFAHNDQKENDPARFTEPFRAYRQNLERFVDEARSRQGLPILATPLVRRRFDPQGNFYDLHGDYPKAVRQVAAERNVPLLDLHKKSEELLKQFGPEASKKLYLWIRPGEFARLPAGLEDDTHFSACGASRVCDLAVEEVMIRIPALAQWLRD